MLASELFNQTKQRCLRIANHLGSKNALYELMHEEYGISRHSLQKYLDGAPGPRVTKHDELIAAVEKAERDLDLSDKNDTDIAESGNQPKANGAVGQPDGVM